MKLFSNFFYFLFLISFSLFSQTDTLSDSNKKNIGKNVIIGIPNKKIKKPVSLDIGNNDGFKKAFDNKNKQDAKKKKEDLKDKGILSAAKISEERFLKSWKKINAPFPKIDQDLGSFRTQSKAVRIICRDFQYPDGDRVTITINDIPVIRNITLYSSYQSFDLPLQVGINKIAFIALNQGTSGPNTAGFTVFDDAGNVISSNEWNLATGAKATVIIAKDK
ncbi:hypothetical protein N9W38_04535 [Flavobacteriaceae bacterium]|nr:hypothetical protein [Flavobacteriaceae bacterium]MDG1423076.1 hypothetical protein [Flavobacteriaceae bacterium]MDG1980634.1 hypothetical protein [Flavobacteriaceae bacterium]MDG2443986.1 hypothetical protein [Flavobacteriaceae bacterium]